MTLVELGLVGVWRGSAEVVVDWAAPGRLTVELVVRPDGIVTGRIGDAQLRMARLVRNRGPLGRALGLKTDYLVRGALVGTIVPGVTRASLSIPLTLAEGCLRGSLTTAGLKFGPRRWTQFVAARLVLRRAQAGNRRPRARVA